MRDRLAAVVAERWDIEPDAISFQDGILRAGDHEAPLSKVVAWLQEEGHDTRLTARYHAPQTRPLGQGGDMHFAFSYGVQAAQVAVDTSSGEVRVLRVVAACEAGRAINPQALLGQIEGGLMMGLGTTLTEAYRVEDGIPRTLRWADYQVPLMGLLPELDLHIVEDVTPAGPYGAKGIGELPSIPTAPAICNAIYNAVGVRVQKLPVRPEDIKS
jgi:xanthine dehydrogenase molybdenum-binding subunit